MKIYTKFGKQEKIRDFLRMLFNTAKDNYKQNVPTYLDEACTQLQCDQHKSRSFGDIYDCLTTYYPALSVKRAFHLILTLEIKYINGKRLYPYFSYCNTIGRPVMYYYHTPSSYYLVSTSKGDYDKYSWAELMEILGLKGKNQAEITAFIDKYRK